MKSCVSFFRKPAWYLMIWMVGPFHPALAEDPHPTFPDTLDSKVWKFAGRSFGGDDVYVDAKRAKRPENDPEAVQAAVLVNRFSCGEGPIAPQTREEARSQCMKSFGYASYIVGSRYWCGNTGDQHKVATYFSLRFDDFDGKGNLVSKSTAKNGMPSVGLIEPDMPSVRARQWLCKNIAQ